MSLKNFILGSAFYSIGNMAGAGMNLLFQFILIMFLNVDDYGIIQPLLQFVSLILLPISAYQFALTKHYATLSPDELSQEMLYNRSQLQKIALIISVLWIMLIPTFKHYFHVTDNVIFILLLISFMLNFLQVPFICRLQAEKQFFIAGLAQIIQGFTRISIGVLFVRIIPNIWGAMIGVIISNISFLISNSYHYKHEFHDKLPINFRPKSFSTRLLLVSLGSVGLFSLLSYSDAVLVRILLPQSSAIFASSILLGKGMIFLTAGISFVLLPLMADRLHNRKKALYIGFASLLVLVLLYNAFFYVFRSFIGQILFKDELLVYQSFIQFMPYYNLMFAPYPLIYYFLNYYLVQENIFYPIVLSTGVIGQYIAIYFYSHSINSIATAIGGVGYTLLMIVLMHAYFSQDVDNTQKITL